MTLSQVTLRGEMAYRALKNQARLEDEYFTPEVCFADATFSGGWPADREGRAMLADTLHARLSGRESAHLERFYEQMPLNEKGYRGPVLEGKADEQQLSGHNWLLRALLEMYEWKHDERSKTLAKGIVEGLYLPLTGLYRQYPVDPAKRVVGGGFAGEKDSLENGAWITSTDIGCAFMPLDALSVYYDLFRDERVWTLLSEMIDVFAKIDLVGLKMQTHASLSATRGILRCYKATGKDELLALAIRVFDTYRRDGMTESYANYNWFDRPEWTEPCAVVDSLLVALTLFDVTGEGAYAEFANRVYFTALGHGQRPNGGFGCDSCLGAGEDGKILSMRTPEAFWCCSMRGAEGFARMAEHLVIERGGALEFPTYADMTANLNNLTITEKTRWPYEGDAEITLRGAWQGLSIRLYAPENACVTVDGSEAETVAESRFLRVRLPESRKETVQIRLIFPLEARWEAPVGRFTPANQRSLWRGALLLSGAKGRSAYPDVRAMRYKGRGAYETADGERYEPVNRPIFAGKNEDRQSMFDKYWIE